MEIWIDELAGALGEDPLSDEETERLLDVARDVAHRVERKITPLAAFVIGSAVGRGLASGASRTDATAAALETVERLLPEAPAEA
ncbi:MAG TPA: DUF6457 domain-containing protein [Actinomycetota bacterium]|nr:DUF6457 domain-containing protein [Actinomycetota bacterium]